jgi:hypothetical protein
VAYIEAVTRERYHGCCTPRTFRDQPNEATHKPTRDGAGGKSEQHHDSEKLSHGPVTLGRCVDKGRECGQNNRGDSTAENPEYCASGWAAKVDAAEDNREQKNQCKGRTPEQIPSPGLPHAGAIFGEQHPS